MEQTLIPNKRELVFSAAGGGEFRMPRQPGFDQSKALARQWRAPCEPLWRGPERDGRTLPHSGSSGGTDSGGRGEAEAKV